ncbi:MAG TPA: YceI family protein [Gemmatimonadaceae bacterium]|nr:YceI family protein [Gemmatimonadaceae bacterium]
MTRIGIVLTLLSAAAGSALAQSAAPQPTSAPAVRSARVTSGTLAFDARARVGDFSGTTQEVTGEVRGAATADGATGWVSFPAASLRTGNGRRDRDMRKSLEADQHPEIRLDVSRITPLATRGDTVDVLLDVTLTVKGIGRPLQVPATVVILPSAYRVTSQFPIDAREWGLKGLSRLLGMLSVDPRMTVRAALEFAVDEEGRSSAPPTPAPP